MLKQPPLEKLHTLHLIPALLCEKKSHESLAQEGSHGRFGPSKMLSFYLISPVPLHVGFVGTLVKVIKKKNKIDRYNGF